MIWGPTFWYAFEDLFSCLVKRISKEHLCCWKLPLLRKPVFQYEVHFLRSCIVEEMWIFHIWVYHPPILGCKRIVMVYSLLIFYSMSWNIVHVTHCVVGVISKWISALLWNFFHLFVVLSFIAVEFLHQLESIFHKLSVLLWHWSKYGWSCKNHAAVYSCKISTEDEKFSRINVELFTCLLLKLFKVLCCFLSWKAFYVFFC